MERITASQAGRSDAPATVDELERLERTVQRLFARCSALESRVNQLERNQVLQRHSLQGLLEASRAVFQDFVGPLVAGSSVPVGVDVEAAMRFHRAIGVATAAAERATGGQS